MHETSIDQKISSIYLKDNCLSFQEMYFKSWISFIFIALSRGKDKRFCGVGSENDLYGNS